MRQILFVFLIDFLLYGPIFGETKNRSYITLNSKDPKNVNNKTSQDAAAQESENVASRSSSDTDNPTSQDNTSDLQTPLSEEALKELQSYKNQYLYLKAEFDNYRKRSLKERSDLIKYGSQQLAMEILNVLDVFEMALSGKANAENVESFKQGFEMTYHQLKQGLEKFDIMEFGQAGEDFNPSLHDAVSSEVSSQFAPGKITQIFKKGYKFHDKIIRAAQVVVAKESDSNASCEE